MNHERFREAEKRDIYRQIADAQLDAWSCGSGYFYWSYKLLLDTVNDPNWIGWDSLDLGKSVDLGKVRIWDGFPQSKKRYPGNTK